jgi:hypothetical protein
MSKKISELTAATDVTASDLFQVVDIEDPAMASSGTNKKVTAQTLGNYLPVRALGSTTSRTLRERFGDTVNVKDFGAAGDGIQDDTSAIQAAIAAGYSLIKDIYIPAGTYKITSDIILAGNNIGLYGTNGTIFKKYSGINCVVITGNFNKIEGITVEGNGFDGSGFGITGSDNEIFNCESRYNLAHGFYRDGQSTTCERNVIESCYAHHNGFVGFACNTAPDSLTLNNVAYFNNLEGITDDLPSYRGVISGNYVSDNCQVGGVGGIGIDQASGGTVIGNIVNNTQANLPAIGFQNNVGNTNFLTVSCNGLFNNTGGGILLGGNTTSGFYAFNNVLSSNTFQNNTGFDIKINTGNNNNTITGIQKAITIIDNSTGSSSVGVGTSNPSEQFHVAGGNALFQRTGGTTGAIYLGGQNSYVFGDISANTVSIGTNNVARVIVKNTAIKIDNLQTYATNAAAITGGLVVNDAYKTSTGEIRIVV